MHDIFLCHHDPGELQDSVKLLVSTNGEKHLDTMWSIWISQEWTIHTYIYPLKFL